MVKIGIIGGSGLDNPEFFTGSKDIELDTKYGEPSSRLKQGKLNNVQCVLLSRHGKEHTLPPGKVNYRANIAALQEAGCTHILATTAVGSLREEIDRGDLVILDQFIDFTRHRAISFHDDFLPHKPVHTSMADPFDSQMRQLLNSSCEKEGIKYHNKGTVITIEGPRFSTRAESYMFRSWGADVINMSVAPECALANEAGIPYAAIAMSTDYDCWKEDEEPVTWDDILEIFSQNVEKVIKVIVSTVPQIADIQ